MPAGTIALTNGSTTVNGTGTSFTTELKPGDFVFVTLGGAPYTLVASTITSNTQLTMAVAFDGPTTTGLAWNAVPASLLRAIDQGILNQFASVARGRILDYQNWQKIYSSDASVTVTRPDRTTFTGPSWGYLASQIGNALTKDGNLAGLADKAAARTNLGLGDTSTKNVGTAAGTIAAGDDSRILGALQKTGGAMTGAIAMGGNAITGSGQLAFSNASNARQTLINTGVAGNGAYIRVPISLTQAYQIIVASAVQTQNSSGDSTLTFPVAFTSITSVILSNGDGGVGNLNMNVLNALRTGGFDCRVYNGSGPQTGAVRINYIAAGLVNI